MLNGWEGPEEVDSWFNHGIHYFSKPFRQNSTENSLMDDTVVGYEIRVVLFNPCHSPHLSPNHGRCTICGDWDYLLQIHLSFCEHLLYHLIYSISSPLVYASSGIKPNRSSHISFFSLWRNLTYTKSWALSVISLDAMDKDMHTAFWTAASSCACTSSAYKALSHRQYLFSSWN